MTTTETRVHDALSAIADHRAVDVDRLWQQFRTDETRPSRQRPRGLMPLAAAAATLLILGLVVVARGQLTGSGSVTPVSAQALGQLPPWPNGTAATAYPLPAPASTPATFDLAQSRVVVYYTADQPSRLCVIEISLPAGQPAHTTSIACDGERGYRITPLTTGRGWILGTAPPGTARVEVTLDGHRATVNVVKRAHMPRAVFAAHYVPTNAQIPVQTITWQFKDAHGRVIEHGSFGPRVLANVTPPTHAPGAPPPYRATPVSAIAEFDEASERMDPVGSHRILHIYWAGDTSGWCSNEQTIVPGHKPVTWSEDCGDTTTGKPVYSFGYWLPKNGYWLPKNVGGTRKANVWGIMPPSATKSVFVTASGRIPMPSAQLTGMPNAVYAASVELKDTATAVMYFLDSDGHVVAAGVWRFPSYPQPLPGLVKR